MTDFFMNNWVIGLTTTCVIGSAMIYTYSDVIQKKAIKYSNRALDIYYNYKYKNCNAEDLIGGCGGSGDYHLSQIICFILDKQIAINIPLEEITNNTNLKEHKVEISHEQIKQMCYDKMKSLTGLDVNNIIIYVYFKHNLNEYIIPVPYQKDHKTQFPIYEIDDLDTCFKTEYTKVDTNHLSSEQDDYLLDVIQMFAGPKGNFYCDLDGYDLRVKPHMIICQKEYKRLLKDETDILKLTTNFYDECVFGHSDQIEID